MGDVLQAFEDALGGHIPPQVKNITEEEVCLRVPIRYRVRVRGTDMQYEVVARFTGFGVPADDAPEVLILEFVSEYSFNTKQDENES